MKKFLLLVLEYLMHASTWKGIIGVAVAMGVSVSPELAAQIVSAGMGLVGLIQIFVDDYDKDKLADTSTENKGG